MTRLELLLATERATLLGWKARVQIEHDGWILSSNDGVIGRLNSVAALCDVAELEARVDKAEHWYQALGQPCAFRVTQGLAPARLEALLEARGYRVNPGSVEIRAKPVRARPADEQVIIDGAPFAEWTAVFEGEGFDATDAAGRAATYARSPGMRFACLIRDGVPVAAGLGALGPFTGIHGMRTAPQARRTGAATAILHALEAEAAAAGATHMFLHVEDANHPATTLYQREGYAVIGAYRYWQQGVG